MPSTPTVFLHAPNTSCPSCLLLISVSCHVFLPIFSPFVLTYLFVLPYLSLSFPSSSAFYKFLPFLGFPTHPFYSVFVILICIFLPHSHISSVHHVFTSHQTLRHISTPSEIPVLLVMEFLLLNQITDLKK